MRTGALHDGILISLVVGGLAVSAWGQAPAGPLQRDPNGPVNCVVKITCNPTLLPLNPDSIQALLESSFVAGEACKEACKASAVEFGYQVEFKPLPGGVTEIQPGPVPVVGMMGGAWPQPPQQGGMMGAAPRGGRMGAVGFGGGGMGGLPEEPGDAAVRPPGADQQPSPLPGAKKTRAAATPRRGPGREPVPEGNIAVPGAPGGAAVPGRPGVLSPSPAPAGPDVPEGAPLPGLGAPQRGPLPTPSPTAAAAARVAGSTVLPLPAPPPTAAPLWNVAAPPPPFPGGGMAGPDRQPATFDVMLPAPRESSILGQVQVFCPNLDRAGNEVFLRAICERLRQALANLHDQELTSVDRQMQISRDEQTRAEKRLRELQERRRSLFGAGQGELMPEAVMDQARRLDLERQRMEMDLIGQQARQNALQQQIKDVGERALKGASDDAMIKPLQEMIEQLRKQLAIVQERYKSGLTPESEVQQVQIAISESEVRLAEARRKTAQAGGGEVLGRLNEELAMLSVNTAETEARLKYIREQMEKNKQLAGAADEYEMQISMAMPYARRAYESSRLRVEALEQRMRTAVAPMVTVIGGSTTKPAK